jgi:hypothetical protein
MPENRVMHSDHEERVDAPAAGEETASASPASAEAQESHKASKADGQEGAPPALSSGVSDLAGAASRVVFQAASILEEEIAAGIVAAKQVEKRLVGTKALPSDAPHALIHRFRKDLHEAVDVAVDLLSLVIDRLGLPDQPAIRVRSDAEVQGTAGARLRRLVVPGPVADGTSGQVTVHLENELNEAVGELSLLCTDLVSASGDRIAARQIQFSPPVVAMGPYGRADVTVSVRVPQGKPAGVYSGLVRTVHSDQLQVLLTVEVG